MKRIIFLVRSTKPFGTQRRDVDYIIEHLIELGYGIDIYDPKQKLLMNLNDRTIKDYNIFPKWMFFSKLYPALNFIVLIRFLLKNRSKYDLVHVLYVRMEYLLIPKLVKGLGTCLYITLFGSDINIRNTINKYFKKIYSLANLIITTNKDFSDKFLMLTGKKEIGKKMRTLMLPQDHFELYIPYEDSYKNICKAKLGIDATKLTVVAGTNSSFNEQHEVMISCLKKTDPDKYHFIFPISNRQNVMTAREEKLANLINDELKQFSKHVITEFLSYDDIRDIRFATDVFLNVRINDQLNASMLENNLAYTDIITGSWLPYGEYSSRVQVKKIDHPDESVNMLEELRKEEAHLKTRRLISNRESVLKFYNADILKEWLALYKDAG